MRRAALTALVFVPFAACKQGPSIPESDGAYSELAVEQLVSHKNGPPVRLGGGGPSRFVEPLYESFDSARAMELVAAMDARSRTAGSPGYDASLDDIAEALRGAGFGSEGRYQVSEFKLLMDHAAWIPRSGRIAMMLGEGGERVLHEFDDPASRDRSMIAQPCDSFSVTAPVAFDLDGLHEGEILVTRTRVRTDLLNRARSRGAVGIVSASLQPYNTDPTGRERHLGAIQHRAFDVTPALPVVQISDRSYRLIEEQYLRKGELTLEIEATTERGGMEARTVVAKIEGGDKADQAVVLASHVLDPGAADNASGAAGQLELALEIRALIESGGIEQPDRTLVFIWGVEFKSSEVWLERDELTPFAAVSGVMIGESLTETAATPLLERYPDPGAVVDLPPDEHTLWGSRPVEDEWLENPNGLSVIARCALVDVGVQVGGWETSENPYEGGTDHETFIRAGIPAVLFWHFTDFTFNTSLDRIEIVDPEELRRMAVAVGATVLAVASPEPGDLDRYLKCNRDELFVRLAAAEEAQDDETAEAWQAWCTGVRHWFRALCLPR